MATRKLSWGILGCARITRRGLIPGIKESKAGTLAALASRDLATARAWAQEFDIPKAYGSYQELLDDPAIEAVYIPFPNELHKPWVIAAADAGKQVLCEKPLALDATEAAVMVEHCQKRGVLLMEAFMWRHQPRMAKLLELVRGGAIGALRLIHSSFSFPIEPGDWRLDRARGGGALFDVGCYCLNTARLFTGVEPIKALAMGHFSDGGVDLSLTSQLEFPDGVLASFDCSFEQPFRCSYELVGTRGSIEVPDAYLPPATGKALARLRTDPSTTHSSEEAGQIRVLEFEPTNQYAEMVDHFGRSVMAATLIYPAESGLSQMRVLDQLIAAARESAAIA